MEIETEVRAKGWKDPKTLSSNTLTRVQWCQEWTDSRNVEPRTFMTELSLINLHVLPKWSTWVIGEINRHEVQKWVAQLKEAPTKSGKPLSSSSITRIVRAFSSSLGAAVKADIIPSNPVQGVSLPKVLPSKDRWLSKEEEKAIALHLPTAQDRAIMATLTCTGMRWGEAMGWHHFRTDWQRRMARVVEVWDGSTDEIKPYSKGILVRDVPIPPHTLEAIAEAKISKKGKICGHKHREGVCRSPLVLTEPRC